MIYANRSEKLMQISLTGEGGTFALFQGLYPKNDIDGPNEDRTTQLHHRRWLSKIQWPLKIWSLFGTALTLSDGIFTPGTSHTSKNCTVDR